MNYVNIGHIRIYIDIDRHLLEMTTGHCALSASLQMIQKWKEWLIHVRCADIQRNCYKQEKWAGKNPVKKFKKGKCNILWRNNPMCHYRLWTIGKAYLQRRSWRSWLTKLNIAMSLCGKEGQYHHGLHQEEHCQHCQGGKPSPLLIPGETMSGVLGTVLCFPVQERYSTIKERPVKSHGDD